MLGGGSSSSPSAGCMSVPMAEVTAPQDAAHFPCERFYFYSGHFDWCGRSALWPGHFSSFCRCAATLFWQVGLMLGETTRWWRVVPSPNLRLMTMSRHWQISMMILGLNIIDLRVQSLNHGLRNYLYFAVCSYVFYTLFWQGGLNCTREHDAGLSSD